MSLTTVGDSGGPGQTVPNNKTQMGRFSRYLNKSAVPLQWYIIKRHACILYQMVSYINIGTDGAMGSKHIELHSPLGLISHSRKQGSVTSESLTLPVPALQVHMVGVPPGDTLFAGQEAHTGNPRAGATYSFTRQTAQMKVIHREVSVHIMCSTGLSQHGIKQFKDIIWTDLESFNIIFNHSDFQQIFTNIE